MDKNFFRTTVKENIQAIPSKSEAHRLLICAALADKPTRIICSESNADIDATVNCLNSLGAGITRVNEGFYVLPIERITNGARLECNESGSTLRFLLPLSAAIGANCRFYMKGRLPQRPLSPLYELLQSGGVILSAQHSNPLSVSGKFPCGDYSIAANVSSQYVSGLLFALAVSEGDSTLTLSGKIESAPYIWMTVDALTRFGAQISFDSAQNIFYISGKSRLSSPGTVIVGGDWSNAAFFLCAGAVGKKPVTLGGLDITSKQGDRAIVDILLQMGASITVGDEITVYPSPLTAIDIDASQIPDLIPILSVAASVANGRTTIFNASRLRLKESDRIESICKMLSALGADISQTADGMVIDGKKQLVGGEVNSFNDHRIAMSAAIASLVCKNAVTIHNFEAINKSYPSFPDGFSG